MLTKHESTYLALCLAHLEAGRAYRAAPCGSDEEKEALDAYIRAGRVERLAREVLMANEDPVDRLRTIVVGRDRMLQIDPNDADEADASQVAHACLAAFEAP